MKILLVDDDKMMVDVWFEMLAEIPGAEVMSADNAQDAMAIIDGEKIDVLICDGRFPPAQGRFNSDDSGPRVMIRARSAGVRNVIAVSGDKDARIAAVESGCATHECAKDAVMGVIGKILGKD